MSEQESKVLSQLAATIAGQVEALREGARRADVDLDGLARSSLDLILQAVSAQLAPLGREASLPKPAREAYAAVVEQVKAWKLESVQAGEHLLELSAGWTCAKCGADAVAGAAVTLAASGAPSLELQCQACGARSPATSEGLAAFKRLFGHLAKPGWSPERSGFRRGGR